MVEAAEEASRLGPEELGIPQLGPAPPGTGMTITAELRAMMAGIGHLMKRTD